MPSASLAPFRCALLVVDLQEKLLQGLEDPMPTLLAIELLQKSALRLEIPVFHTLQNRSKLGEVPEWLSEPGIDTVEKMSFNALSEASIRQLIEAQEADQWIVVGLEAHVCVLQTAKALAAMGKQVVVAADATASRGLFDYASALSELRSEGIRVTTVQTIVFEWLQSADHPHFRTILPWIKKQAEGELFEDGSSSSQSTGSSCCSSLESACCQAPAQSAQRCPSEMHTHGHSHEHAGGHSHGHSHGHVGGHTQGGCCQSSPQRLG